MAKNPITVIEESKQRLLDLNSTLEITNTEILKISSNARAIGKDFFSLTTPKQVNTALKERATHEEKIIGLVKIKNQTLQNLEKTEAKIKIVTSDNNKELIKKRFELQQLNKAEKQAAVLSSSLASAYQKQSIRLIQLRNRYKEAALTQGEASKKAQNLRKEVTKLDARLKRVDANVGQFQRSVGNYGKAMSSAVGAARNLASAMGLVGGAFLVVRVIRDAVRVIKEFDKANATLASILQQTREQTKALSDEAQRLGSITVKTASQVTELQIAYARLGFSQQQIIDLTEATIQGSIAMNSELGATATLTGAVINTFKDFGASDAPQVLDVLALATAKSALNFEKLNTGIPIVAGAAEAAGIPFTTLVALMGKLSDSGIDVSTSSTALRNIFIESAAKGLSYGQILDKIKNSTDKLTASNDEFGKRSAVSASILAENISKTEELDESLQQAAGTADRMANEELNTLDGALKLLTSAWEGYILRQDEASGATNFLKEAIQFLGTNLSKILNSIVVGTGLFVVYKTAVIAVGVAKKLSASFTVAYRVAVVALNRGLISTTKSLRVFRVALINTGIGAAVVAITAIVGALFIWNEKLKEINEQHAESARRLAELNKGINEERKGLNTLVNSITQTNKGEARRDELIKELNLKYPSFNKFIKDEDTSNKALKIALAAVNDEYIKRLAVNRLIVKLDLEGKQEALADATGKSQTASSEYEEILTRIKTELTSVGVNTSKVTGSLEKQATELRKLISAEQARITQAKANGTATKAEIANLTKLEKFLKSILQVRGESIKLDTRKGDASQDLTDVEKEIDLLRERLGLKKEEAEFDGNEVVIIGSTKKKKTDPNKAKKDSRDSEFELKRAEIKAEIDKQRAIVEATNVGAGARLAALSELTFQSLKLIDLEKTAQQKKYKNNADELARIDIETTAKFGDTIRAREAITKQILKERFDNIKASLKDAEKEEQTSADKQIQILNDKLSKKLEDESLSLEERKSLVQANEDAIVLILEASAKKQIEQQIKIAETALNNPLLSPDQRIALEQFVTEQKINLSNVELENKLSNIDRQIAAEKKLAQLKAQLVSEASTVISDALGFDTNTIDTFLTGLVDGFDNAAEGVGAAMAVAGEVVGAVFDAKIMRYDEDIQRNNDYYAELLNNENLNEEQRSALEAEREAKTALLERKKRTAQIKQARFEKLQAALQIGINTAVGITKAIAQFPLTGGLPFTAIVAALGALQLGAVLAAPLPKYKDGRKGGPAEIAIVGDGGVSEVVEKTSGLIRITPNSPTITQLDEGDIVHKSRQAYIDSKSNKGLYNDIHRGVAMANLDNNIRPIVNSQNNGSKDIVRAIEKNKANIRITNNNNLNDMAQFWASYNDTL